MRLKFAAIALLLTGGVYASDVTWTRFKGKVKAVNQKASTVTIQNGENDLITVKVNDDVTILSGKDAVGLAAVNMDDKITLVYSPRGPEPRDPEEPAPGGVYPPARR